MSKLKEIFGKKELTEKLAAPEVVESTWKGRLLIEQKELSLKVSSLQSFISTADFRALSRPEKANLKSQLKYMGKYLIILNRRVASIKK